MILAILTNQPVSIKTSTLSPDMLPRTNIDISSFSHVNQQTEKVWRYSLADWQKAVELIECIEWDSILPQDVDDQIGKAVFSKSWKSVYLILTAKVKRNLPWLNKGILNAERHPTP